MSVCRKHYDYTQNFLQSDDESLQSRFSNLSIQKGSRVESETEGDKSAISSVTEEKLFRNIQQILDEPPQIIGWRKAQEEDIPSIENLQTLTGDLANSLFRQRQPHEFITKNLFPIVQYDSRNDLVSFTAYDFYPDIPPLNLFWDDWIRINYGFRDMHAGNVVFIHYMLWQPRQEKSFLCQLLETLFSEFMFLKYLIIIKPPNAVVPDFYKPYFIPIFPLGLGHLPYNSLQFIYVCLRATIIHPLYIRPAFFNELDVVKLTFYDEFRPQSGTNKACNFDLFNCLHESTTKTLISQIDGVLTGVMILNLNVDLETLNREFELAPFHGLRKQSPHDGTETIESASSTIVKNSLLESSDSHNVVLSTEYLFSQMNWEIMTKKEKTADSSTATKESRSSESVTSTKDSSGFSLFTFSSLMDSSKSKMDEPSIVQDKPLTVYKPADVKPEIGISKIGAKHFFFNKYHGASNAFAIDFFAFDRDKIDEKLSSLDFLISAFTNVPEKEYCLLLIPTDFLSFPLLEFFVRVTPKPLSGVKQELFLCHKDFFSVSSISTVDVKRTDLLAVSSFLDKISGGDIIFRDICNCFIENEGFRSFVLKVEDKIIGLSLISCEDSAEKFKMYFDITQITAVNLNPEEKSSVIKHLIINPHYHNYARFFLHDIMRLVDVTCLYFALTKASKAGSNEVLPQLELFGKKKEGSLGLYFISPRLCIFSKAHMSVVIIVVGASRTALSFFESLIFGSSNTYTNFNNLICVTPHRLEPETSNQDIKNFMFPIRDSVSKSYRSLLSLETYVNFIYGVMTEINRSEKYIVINNKSNIKYDYLILTCGLQYMMPVPATRQSKAPCKTMFRSTLARFLDPSYVPKRLELPKHPSNMFIINTRQDAENAMRCLQIIMSKPENVQDAEKKIIVYGHNLQVFLTIHTLLKLGIPGEFIAFVEPFPSEKRTVTIFNDRYIDQAVIDAVKEHNVSYYMEYFLHDWSINAEDFITSITFHSKRRRIVLQCLAFFPFLEKLVSDITYTACNEAGLLYNGKIIINHNFRTNDEFIYAAGPFTKYSGRYFASERNHQYYNSEEVGRKLAEIIQRKIDPKTRFEKDPESLLVPRLTSPIILFCQLPGDFNFFIIRKPGKDLALETAYNLYDYGEVLTTGNCKMRDGYGYFRLHLSPEGFVQSIMCFSKNEIDYINLACLYGLHEKFLNNLLFRYDMTLIPDLFSYFRQPWALALFHEKFKLVRDFNKEAFYRSTSGEENFAQKVERQLELNKWQPLPEEIRKDLKSDFFNSSMREEVQNNLMQFLEYFKEELPVYATNSDLVELLFKNQKT